MPLAKSKKVAGLGNSLMNDRFGKGKGADRKRSSAVVRTDHNTGKEYITNDKKEASWVKMRSVTEQGALDEFLATAELAGTDFAAEKMNNVKIIHTDQKNPYLLSAAEERAVLGKHKANRGRLAVPRRPKWDESTSAGDLDTLERESFLTWRRGLAELQENNDLLMTPFERNLEVWRQLWRVIERSDLIVQIVDARNPLLFRSEDLETYVTDVDPKKRNLLLINKADMMTTNQRKAWAAYLKGAGIAHRFFSASLAKELNEAREADEFSEDGAEGSSEDEEDEEDEEDDEMVGEGEDEDEEEDDDEDEDEEGEEDEDGRADEDQQEDAPAQKETVGSGEKVAEHEHQNAGHDGEDEDEDVRILTVDELESVFLQHAPKGSGSDPEHKMQVGLVGYPNVGKSSTINALIGAKKVSVSSTPGKTKHFQTIHLSDKVVLCDCPGLVFPNFASTKAELVCNGILPIDQLREFTGPASLVAQRIPLRFLEAIYGIHVKLRPLEEGGTGVPTAEELLRAYARARGFTTQGVGQPDESRAARYVLKDYVNGKLLYCEPPPGGLDPEEFNSELYDEAHLPEKRRAALAAAVRAEGASTQADPEDADEDQSVATEVLALPAGPKSKGIDDKFFARGQGASRGHASMPFNHKYSERGQKALSGRKARTMTALKNDLAADDPRLFSGKKHFKGGVRGKKKKTTSQMDLD